MAAKKDVPVDSSEEGSFHGAIEGGQQVVDIGELGTRIPITEMQAPLLGKPSDSFRKMVPGWWPEWMGVDDSHLSYVVTSFMVALVCAAVGVGFYLILENFIQFFWEVFPDRVADPVLGGHLWAKYLTMVALCTLMGFLVGCSLNYIGFPGDLPFMVYCVHYHYFIPLKYFLPMLLCSLVSIAGGGSLGPEAAIVLLCATSAGAVGQMLGHTGKRLRSTTLMGMACGFAAFFGVPVGGAFFALEVSHRMGLEYYEIASYAVFSGTICCVLFHNALSLPLGPIWVFTSLEPLRPNAVMLMQGAMFGCVGALGAVIFLQIHALLKKGSDYLGLKKNQLVASTLAGFLLALLGLLVPQSLFWGEWEVQSIIDRGASPLPHIWPKEQIFGASLYSPWYNLVVAAAKMVAISITIQGGFRGGFIFPFFLTGAAIGSAIQIWIPSIPLSLATMCTAAALDVAVTRTPFGTTLILACLSGEENLLQPLAAASMVSLMLTNSKRFQLIKPQRARKYVEEDLEVVEYDHNNAE